LPSGGKGQRKNPEPKASVKHANFVENRP